MKQLCAFSVFLACLLGGLLNTGTASAQCSGQFSILYPGAATATSYNSGSNPASVTYCPDGTSTATFTIIEGSNTGGGETRIYVGDVTVPNKGYPAGTPFKTVITTSSGSTTFTLPVSSSGTNKYTLVHGIVGCQNDKAVDVPLTLTPAVTLTSNAAGSGVCAGTPVRLTATGGAATNPLYTFFANGTQIGQNSTGVFDVTPQRSTNYTVQTASAGCNGNTATQAITVNTNDLSISSNAPNNTTSTPGTAVTLTSAGGTSGSYTYSAFSDGVTTPVPGNGPSVTVSPTRTTRYTVTGPTAVGGCPSSAVVQIQVGNTTLPVGLTSFTAAWKGRAAELRWTTAFEINNSHFSVERSFNGADFRAVGRVNGAGTTNGATTSYHFSDPTPVPAGTVALYYRLRQVDLSGANVLSNVQVVTVSGVTNGLAATVAPNPATDYATVRFTAATAGRVTLEVRNVLGQKVLLKTLAAQPGLMEIPLPEVAAWRTGMYFLVLSHNQQRQVLRLSRR